MAMGLVTRLLPAMALTLPKCATDGLASVGLVTWLLLLAKALTLP